MAKIKQLPNTCTTKYCWSNGLGHMTHKVAMPKIKVKGFYKSSQETTYALTAKS